MADRTAPAAIVGAGIAGLVAALALARTGRASTVFERAPALREVGAGLQLSPNALRVLDRLGLLAPLRERAVAADAVTLRGAANGRPLARVPVAGSDGAPYLSLHRAALQSALLDAVRAEPLIALQLGRQLTGWAPAEGGLRLDFADGASTRAPFVLAADGVRSRVAALAGLPPARPTGALAWRATLPRAAAPEITAINAWLGSRRHAVAYPIEGGASVNLVLIDRDEDSKGAEARAWLHRRFGGWDASLHRMIEAAGEPTPWPILATPPERPFALTGAAAAPVLLLGDAGHAMPPYAAQGAALAIEDGFVAAALIARHADPAAAFRAFEAERRRRVAAVRRRVAFHAFAYHLPRPVSLARDAVLRASPPERLARGLAWLYDWAPPTTP